MKPRADSYRIVINGFWNRMIFTMKWVMDELFHREGSEGIEQLVHMAPIAPLVYRDNQVILQITDQQIIIQARTTDVNCLERAEKMACEALNALPKTPVSALGVNFGFCEVNPHDELLKLFNLADDVDIGSSGWAIEAKKIIRRLTKDNMTLNLSITQDAPSNILIDANFHYLVKSAMDAVECIEGRTPQMLQGLTEILEDIYSLHIENEQAEDEQMDEEDTHD